MKFVEALFSRQGQKIVDHFPVISQWAFDVRFILNINAMDPNVVRMVLDTAGISIGLHSQRPQNKGTNGIWRTDKWEAVGTVSFADLGEILSTIENAPASCTAWASASSRFCPWCDSRATAACADQDRWGWRFSGGTRRATDSILCVRGASVS